MDTSASVVIPLPIEAVFGYLSDISKMKHWVSGVTDARLISPQLTRGALFEVTYRSGWRSAPLELEITEFEAPVRFGTQSVRGPFAFQGRFDLTSVDGGTAVTNTIEAGPDSLSTRILFVLFGPLVRKIMSKRLLSELEDLRLAILGGKRSVNG